MIKHAEHITEILKTTMLKSSICGYSFVYILMKGNITITEEGADTAAKQADERNERVTFKNFASFTDSISELNHNQEDNAKDLDALHV